MAFPIWATFVLSLARPSEHDFLVEFFDLLPDQTQHLSTFARQPVVLARAAPAVRVRHALEPSQPLHPVQERIKRARADFISVPAQFRRNPLPMNCLFPRVMKNM